MTDESFTFNGKAAASDHAASRSTAPQVTTWSACRVARERVSRTRSPKDSGNSVVPSTKTDWRISRQDVTLDRVVPDDR